MAENWVFKQSLQIPVLQIVQNITSHPKSHVVNYIIIFESFVKGVLADQNMLLSEDCRELNS